MKIATRVLPAQNCRRRRTAPPFAVTAHDLYGTQARIEFVDLFDGRFAVITTRFLAEAERATNADALAPIVNPGGRASH